MSLLIQKLLKFGEQPVKKMRNQPDALTSSKSSNKTPVSWTHTVNINLTADVYGYCFYNDLDAGNSNGKVYETQQSMLLKALAKQNGK